MSYPHIGTFYTYYRKVLEQVMWISSEFRVEMWITYILLGNFYTKIRNIMHKFIIIHKNL